MNLFNERWRQINKKIKSNLYVAILFLVIAIGCFTWAFSIDNQKRNDSKELYELIYEGSEEEKKITSFTVVAKPYVFAEYDEDITSPKYYILVGEDYSYVGYLDYNTYLKLNDDSILENPITIEGVTKKIPDDVIDIAIEVYNELLEEDFLTKENYKNYIGEICIDTVSDLVDNVLQIILGILFLIISIIYFIVYIIQNSKIKK